MELTSSGRREDAAWLNTEDNEGRPARRTGSKVKKEEKTTHRDDQRTETMSAEATRPVALPSLAILPETVNGEQPQTMGAGPPRPLPALAEHGDGQNAHTVGRGAARPVAAADAAAVVAEVLGKATYTSAERPQAVRGGAARAVGAVRVLAGDGDGGRAAGAWRDQGVAPLRVHRLVQRALLVLHNSRGDT